MSILSQASSPVGPHHTAIQTARYCSHIPAVGSFVRTCHAPCVQQVDGPCLMQRCKSCTRGYTNCDFLPQRGWQPQRQCSFKYPYESNQHVFNTAPSNSCLPEYRNNYDEFYKHEQGFPKEKLNAPFVHPPECFTDDDLGDFQDGRGSRYNQLLEELTMRTEVSFCTQTVLPEIPPQSRNFTKLFDRRPPTHEQDRFSGDFTYAVNTTWKNDRLIDGYKQVH